MFTSIKTTTEPMIDGERVRDCWRTPRLFFAKLHKIFGFTVDACASPHNALLPCYWTRHDDCLAQDWTSHVVFCNPPFSLQRRIPAKASTAKQALVFIYGTGLFTKYLASNPPSHVIFPPGRIAFIPPNGIRPNSNPPYGVALCVYGDLRDGQKEALAAVGLVLQSQQKKEYPMSVHVSDKDLARLGLEVNGDGTALVPVRAPDELAVFDQPPTLATTPGTDIAVVPTTLPDAAWTLDDLGQYARRRLTDVTTSIFQAGRALRLARDQVKKKRAWGKWLKSQQIPRTSAWEAIELFEKAETEDALVGLTRGQALKRFGVRANGKKASGGGDGAGSGGRKPPKPPASSSAGEGPPAKEDTLLLKLTKIEDWLDLCFEQRSRIDWSREDPIACMKMIDRIYLSMDDIINEVHDHVVISKVS